MDTLYISLGDVEGDDFFSDSLKSVRASFPENDPASLEALKIITEGLAQLDIHRRALTVELITRSKGVDEFETDSMLAFVASAKQWLLCHVHNPYPSHLYKSQSSEKYSIPIKSVNTWFANARRRVGWTSISKRFFNGNRPDTVEYAHRVFKRKSSDTNPDDVIAAEFLSMRAKIESLYQGKLAEDVPTKVFSLLEDDRIVSKADSKNSRKRKRLEGLSDDTGSMDIPEGIPTSNLKRRRATVEGQRFPSSSELTYLPYDPEKIERSRTRFRTPSSSSTQSSSSRSPTPMPSTPKDDFVSSLAFDEWSKGVEIDSFKLDESPLSSPIEIPTLSPTRSRKRRLSESDEQPSKRPRGAALPRLHTVSDSYLLGLNDPVAEATLSKLDFTLPEPAALTELPQIEVPEFLQVWPSEETRDSASSSCAELPNGQPSAPPTLLLESEHDGISNELSAQPDATDLNDFDKFLEQLAADPSLMLPTLPQNIPEIPWFDTSSNTEYDLSALDLPLATSTPVKKGSRCREASLDLFSIPHTAIPEGEDDIFSIDKLQDIPAPISPVDSDPTKVQSSVGTTDSSKSSPETIEDSECSREDKLQKLQMLMAEVEKLQKEIGS